MRSEAEDPAYMDFEEPDHPYDSAPKRGKKKSKSKIPRLPEKQIVLSDELRSGVSVRSRAAANLRVEGYTYAEIADILEYDDAQGAEKAVMAVLAAIHGNDDYETIRLIVERRAEEQFRRSFTMGGADYLVLESGKRIANEDKLRWHQQAAVDLMNYAKITGTIAPTRVQITPDEAELDRIITEIAHRAGQEDVLEAEVIELDVIPEITDGDDDATPRG
jgi:hypothetical protein